MPGLGLGLWLCEFAGRLRQGQGVCSCALQPGIRGRLWSPPEGVCVWGVLSYHFLLNGQEREEGDQRLASPPTMCPGKSVLQGALNLGKGVSVCVYVW